MSSWSKTARDERAGCGDSRFTALTGSRHTGQMTYGTRDHAGMNGSTPCGVSTWVGTPSSAKSRSICSRSSAERRRSTAATCSFDSSLWRIPTSATVTAGFPRTHAIASCATDRAAARGDLLEPLDDLQLLEERTRCGPGSSGRQVPLRSWPGERLPSRLRGRWNQRRRPKSLWAPARSPITSATKWGGSDPDPSRAAPGQIAAHTGSGDPEQSGELITARHAVYAAPFGGRRRRRKPMAVAKPGQRSSPGQTRTADTVVNSHPLYQLSYRGMTAAWPP